MLWEASATKRHITVTGRQIVLVPLTDLFDVLKLHLVRFRTLLRTHPSPRAGLHRNSSHCTHRFELVIAMFMQRSEPKDNTEAEVESSTIGFRP